VRLVLDRVVLLRLEEPVRVGHVVHLVPVVELLLADTTQAHCRMGSCCCRCRGRRRGCCSRSTIGVRTGRDHGLLVGRGDGGRNTVEPVVSRRALLLFDGNPAGLLDGGGRRLGVPAGLGVLKIAHVLGPHGQAGQVPEHGPRFGVAKGQDGVFIWRMEHAEPHEELGAASRGVELEQSREGGRAGRGQRRSKRRPSELARIVGRRGLRGRRGRVFAREPFYAPQDDGLFVASPRENQVAKESDASGGVKCERWPHKDKRNGKYSLMTYQSTRLL